MEGKQGVRQKNRAPTGCSVLFPAVAPGLAELSRCPMNQCGTDGDRWMMDSDILSSMCFF